jgi:ATP-dependent protease Clp ATPase subunit
MTKDISGRGVQFSMLKLLEETEVDLRSGNDMHSQLQAFFEMQHKGKISNQVINTRHILFIISGAFNNLTDIVKSRLNKNAIGFGNKGSSSSKDDEIFLNAATTKDFIDFGFEPEFIGRLPIRVACSELSKNDLYDILKNSSGSIIKQYEQSFKAYGIDIIFNDNALRKIANIAYNEKTGARALMTVCEKILRQYKFELPSTGVTNFIITEEIVDREWKSAVQK